MASSEIDSLSLIAAANEAKQKAYAPYSKFRVGAALLCDDGTVITGCNIENASYPMCTCAERTAYVKAVSSGKTNFKAIAVTSDSTDEVWPCGACRQVMAEFGMDVLVIISPKDKVISMRLSELLPAAFSPKVLQTYQQKLL